MEKSDLIFAQNILEAGSNKGKEDAIALISIDDIFNGRAYFSWGMTGTGFGQLSFNVDQKTQVITCMNEGMSRDTVRKILVAFANHIADNAILEDA